ncbi:ankyrin repeat and mynd domain-containing 2 [Favolaschia claudopus]|uniref:Ankyrin repeat and mynd domain-containing 2 n=1 Tax=Favolaschia claudopus TaxID=2862362 RepID=A0AAW0DC20_9AGAR
MNFGIGVTQLPAVRFHDTDILPLSAPPDHPRIIKSGVGSTQHPKSPRVAGSDMVFTLLYQLEQPELLERLLDTDGTATFFFRMMAYVDSGEDLYVKRDAMEVEIGFLSRGSKDESKPNKGVRYTIGKRDTSSVYKTGPWDLRSAFDSNGGGGTTKAYILAQDSDLAHRIWNNFHLHQLEGPRTRGQNTVRIEWAGMSSAAREKYDRWIAGCRDKVEREKTQSATEYQKLKAEKGINGILADGFEDYKKTALKCRAECGVAVATMRCGKCHFARYCSAACQRDDWKYHKSYCGKEDTWDWTQEKFEDLLK